jgi:hypothetical protein
MKLRINQNSVKKKLQAPNKKMEQAAIAVAIKQLDEAKEQMLTEFDNHPVTKEIQGGIESSNISGTLGGYGNLFSFIGFNKGSNPIGFLRDLIVNSITLPKKPFAKRRGVYFFRIKAPTMRDLETETPLPYEESRSWLRGIERGISGLGNFIFRKRNNSYSRSGGGLQTERRIRGGVRFGNIPYLSRILENFYKKAKIKK